jgi:hypothetical protein
LAEPLRIEERELEAGGLKLGRLLTHSLLSAQNRAPCGQIGGTGVEIREYLVLRFDGSTVRFPVRDGDVAQARLRVALCQRPEDCVVAVTEDAYIRLGPDSAVDPRVAVES